MSIKFSNAIFSVVPTSKLWKLESFASEILFHSSITCGSSAASTCKLFPNSAISFLNISSVSGAWPWKNPVSSFICTWFGIVSKNERNFSLKFSHEFNPLFSASLISTSPKSYSGIGFLLVLKILIFFISGIEGNVSLMSPISFWFNSNSPSANLTSCFKSSDISSHKSSSEIVWSLLSKVNACKIVVLPLSFRPTKAARSPTLISPESWIQR